MTQPRKDRKFFYNAPLHIRRKMISSHLSEDLMLKYRKRSVPVIRGDTVKVVRGSYKGVVGKVRRVNVRKQRIEIEGVTITKVDGKKVPYPIHASNVMIMRLNLTDPWRRRKLEEKLTEEEKKKVEEEAEEQMKEMEEEAMKAEEEEAKKKEEKEEEKEEKEEEKEEKEEEERKEEKEKEIEAKKEIEEEEIEKEEMEVKKKEEKKKEEETGEESGKSEGTGETEGETESKD